jgi:hypothetical protein
VERGLAQARLAARPQSQTRSDVACMAGRRDQVRPAATPMHLSMGLIRERRSSGGPRCRRCWEKPESSSENSGSFSPALRLSARPVLQPDTWPHVLVGGNKGHPRLLKGRLEFPESSRGSTYFAGQLEALHGAHIGDLGKPCLVGLRPRLGILRVFSLSRTSGPCLGRDASLTAEP